MNKTIEQYMTDKKWIVTYDNHPAIGEIYSRYDSHFYYLSYSITKPTKGIEYIFFSDNTIMGEIETFLQLV